MRIEMTRYVPWMQTSRAKRWDTLNLLPRARTASTPTPMKCFIIAAEFLHQDGTNVHRVQVLVNGIPVHMEFQVIA